MGFAKVIGARLLRQTAIAAVALVLAALGPATA